MNILSLVGRSGCGKTTVLEQWIKYLRQNNWRVAAIKHSHHSLQPDSDHKDTTRLQADCTVFATSEGIQIRGLEHWTDLAYWLAPQFDILLIEGGKTSPFPKIEVLRGHPPMMPENALLATIGDQLGHLPCLPLNSPQAWTDFYTSKALLNSKCSALPKLSS